MRLVDAKRIYEQDPDLDIDSWGNSLDLEIAVDDIRYKFLSIETLEACLTILKDVRRKKEAKAREEDARCH